MRFIKRLDTKSIIRLYIGMLIGIMCIVSVQFTNVRADFDEAEAQIVALKKQNMDCTNEIHRLSSLDYKHSMREKEFESALTEKDVIIENLNTKIVELNTKLEIKNKYTGIYVPDVEYTIADKVWNRLKSEGVSDKVACGIMGNFMAEVGGQTLDFSEWQKWSQGTYYGIAQWTGSRKDRMFREYGSDIDSQIDFLIVEMFEMIPKNSDFWQMEDESDAALYFAQHYEKCSSKYYSVRMSNAKKAYKHYVIDRWYDT